MNDRNRQFQNYFLSLCALLLSALLLTMIPVSAAANDTVPIPLGENFEIVLDRFENTEEELVLAFLFRSVDEGVENVCEFEDAELDGVIGPETDQPIDASDCGAVRIVYRYAPSPIPTGADIIFTELNLGPAGLEALLADETEGNKVNPKRIFFANIGLIVKPAFFGEAGGKRFEELPKSPAQIPQFSLAATRDSAGFKLQNAIVGWNHFEFELVDTHQYVHQFFTPADTQANSYFPSDRLYFVGYTVFLDGVAVSGGAGMPESSQTELFEGPVNAYTGYYSFTDKRLSGQGLYRLAFSFGRPTLRIAFTPDGKNVYSWIAESNARPELVIRYPGSEEVEALMDAEAPVP